MLSLSDCAPFVADLFLFCYERDFMLSFSDCAPLVADLFSFCFERDFMLSLSEDTQADVIEAFNSRDLD